MKKLIALFLLSIFAAAAHAAPCEVASLVPGKGWEYRAVPCEKEPFAEDDARKKKACGKDYGALRIGMTRTRVQQCYEALSFETETVTAAGTTEIWRSTFQWIQVRDGRVVGFTRRTY